MHLDVALLAFLLACFGAGVLRGLLRQCLASVALLAGFAAACLAFLLARLLPVEGAAAALLPAALCAIAFAAACFLAWRIGAARLNRRAAAFIGGAGDRLLGGAYSFAKGLALAIVALWLVDALWGARIQGRPRAAELWRGSRAARFACRHNYIAPLTAVRRLKGLLDALRGPDARKPLRDQPAYAALVSNPRYRAVRDDRELRDALARKQWGRLIIEPDVYGLLADTAFRRAFLAVRWEAAAGPGAAPLAAVPSSEYVPTPASHAPPQGMPLKPSPPAYSRVVLKNGSTLRGRISAESPDRITVEIPLQSGVMEMELAATEIERIEPAADR